MRTGSVIALASAVAFSGCLPGTGEGLREGPAARAVGRELLFEIGPAPTAQFLQTVSGCAELSDAEKRLVRNDMASGVYSHCRLAKYRQGGKLFIEIDQFNPRREVGTDPAGRPLVEGGSGSLSRYELRDGRWTPGGGIEYD